MNIADSTIFVKTELGRTKYADNALSANARRLFVMVDGKKTVKDLLKFVKLFGGVEVFDELLQLQCIAPADSSSSAVKTADKQFTAQERTHILREEVEKALTAIYGPGIANELDRIAQTYSPEQYPVEFLNECREKTMLVLNKKQVESIFAPLYAIVTR